MNKIIRIKSDPDEFRTFAGKNLSRQYDFLEATVKAALPGRKNLVTRDVICKLNKHAVELLIDEAGEYRTRNIRISNSEHVPPDHKDVPRLMKEMLAYLTRNWEKKPAIHLAAYALWRLGWIHPFMEGNGRTARAFSLLIICMKNGVWLPGKNIIPSQVRRKKMAYYRAMNAADKQFREDGTVDLSLLEAYLTNLLFKGLSRLMLRPGTPTS